MKSSGQPKSPRQLKSPRLLVGLTGNYGTGKTTALRMFKELGAFAMDADAIVAGLLEEIPVLEKLREILGAGVFDKDGRLIKEKVSDIIFSDSALRRRIEDVLHPLVFEVMGEALKGTEADIVVMEVPLLFEGQYEERFHKTIAVYADEPTALQRLEKAGTDRQDVLLRLQSQMPPKEKAERADFTIDNSGTVEDTKRQVEEIYEELKTVH